MAHPHDISDLYLAPVALALDARIEALGRLDRPALRHEIALEGEYPDWTREFRATCLLAAITRGVRTHGWDFEWDPRGVRVSNHEHTYVLGVPLTLTAFLEDSEEPAR
jgi:hypothetical protein